VLVLVVKPALAEANDQVTLVTRSFTPGIGQGDDITDELRFPARIADFEFQLEFEATAFLLLFFIQRLRLLSRCVLEGLAIATAYSRALAESTATRVMRAC
jgi:hypothetical protein